ncbi:hypothetical protein ACFL0Z_01490 [Patescibacteria group bacterium]
MTITLTQNVVETATALAKEMIKDGVQIREFKIGGGVAFVAADSSLLAEPSTVNVDGTDFFVSLWKQN